MGHTHSLNLVDTVCRTTKYKVKMFKLNIFHKTKEECIKMYCTNLSQNEDRMVTKFGNVAGSPRISEEEIATPVLQSTEKLRRLKP